MLQRLLLLFFIGLNIQVYSQPQTIAAFKKGDVSLLSNVLADKVNLTFDDQSEILNKTQALVKLEGFFKEHKITSFKSSHTGQSPDNNSFYTIGYLKTSTGTFRLFIKYSKVDGIERIKEMLFNSNDWIRCS